MSWKSFVTAGLLCALAMPAFAAPTISIVPGGTFSNNHLNAAGDWVWRVTITPDLSLVPDSSGTPLAAELGFRETSGELLSAVSPDAATNFLDSNPGSVIFGWETLASTGGTGDCGSGTPGMCAFGVQTNLANDEAFASLGSVNYTTAGGKTFLEITIDGPSSTGSLETDLELLGAYGAGGLLGRIAQVTGMDGAEYLTSNFDTFSGVVGRQAKSGDINLDGQINIDDYQILSVNFHPTNTGKFWYQGDFNGDGRANIDDYQLMSVNFGPSNSYTVFNDPTLGSGGGGAVPEPASAALAILAASVLACSSRKR